ncbi:YheC/YheD family protein [Paenibacillus protaetiae]|uniref:YheC/YheD family protein n=1 Tax=Paenibacillus protaetiae TaxID=2509456 RepID=A0A4V0YER2_9BACL|nr:YheC/YheD family protein [Paenibacillus protaetiae]QAY65101.1 YheC/YheD family protein [Paenibacillus protaetiae]
MTQPVLGILTLYLNDQGTLEEKSVYAKMISSGRKLGLTIFVFTPDDVDFKQNKINALFYSPETRKWTRKWTGFPHMIYDRCRIQKSPRFERLREFRSKYGHLTFLNRPLRNKWTVHRTLSKDSRFRGYLPATRLAASVSDVSDMLRKHSLLFLKPINGTGGRGILQIERKKDGKVLLQGRNQARKIIQPIKVTQQGLGRFLESWNLKTVSHIVQQGLHLKLPNGRVHDYRMLVQKDRSGEWKFTGCAGRVGPLRSVTSNLHGGGQAIGMTELLTQWVGAEKAAAVRQEAEQFGIDVAKYLEQSFGALCELALDLAIDRSGHIWLLEVNPKPAREVFAQAGEKETYRKAIIRPLEYALYVYERKKNRSSKLAADSKSKLSKSVKPAAHPDSPGWPYTEAEEAEVSFPREWLGENG